MLLAVNMKTKELLSHSITAAVYTMHEKRKRKDLMPNDAKTETSIHLVRGFRQQHQEPLLLLGRGQQLSCKKDVWIMSKDINTCGHPGSKLSIGKMLHFGWWTCQNCGARWERLISSHERVTHIMIFGHAFLPKWIQKSPTWASPHLENLLIEASLDSLNWLAWLGYDGSAWNQ